MALRGPGSTKRKAVREEMAAKKPRLPRWKFKGLSRVERVIRFVESLPVTKGPLAGKKIKLLPGQRDFLHDIYSRSPDDPVNLAILSEPRGNGKTGLIQALALCHLLGPEAQSRGEVYAAAVDRTQSTKMFAEVEATLHAVPELFARVNIQRSAKRIEVMEGDGAGSIFEAMSGDARKGHGLAPSFFAYDELARVPDRELFDALLTGMGKRPCLGVILSTQAASDDHTLSVLIDDAMQGSDRAVICRITAAPADADPFDPDTLQACNPALGIYLDEKTLLDEQQKARRIPSFEANFRNLRLNQRVDAQAERRIVPAAEWTACVGTVDPEELKGRKCIGGLDLSGRNDLTALVLLFEREAEAEGESSTFDVLPFIWTPEGAMERRRPAEQERMRQWIDKGHVIAIPGPVIRYGFIATKLAELAVTYKIQSIAYDRWRIDDLKLELDDAGCSVPLEPFGQGYQSISPALDAFQELVLTRRLRHDNPVLTAAVANAIVVSDPAGNNKIDKEKSNHRAPYRIDPAVALAMAIGLNAKFEPEPPKPTLDGFLRSPIMVI